MAEISFAVNSYHMDTYVLGLNILSIMGKIELGKFHVELTNIPGPMRWLRSAKVGQMRQGTPGSALSGRWMSIIEVKALRVPHLKVGLGILVQRYTTCVVRSTLYGVVQEGVDVRAGQARPSLRVRSCMREFRARTKK